ncbi:hypothetical protein [uncultured Roseobacter sp.]|uniref:hypothetical protein n=1 Tax=uncultured Roseobacter sp. TaxID=114847 RepID=UPI002617E9A3|nr:hypothetical protein [uncultured Roseobacter sp.]
MRRALLTALILLIVAPAAMAQQSVIEKAAKLAQDSCTVSSVQGSRRTSDGKRLVTLPGSNEEIEISKERWNGIQQVLREHQQKESANYRDCVRDLTRTFIDAEKEMQQQAVVQQPQQNNGICEYENDGFCDVPGDCPFGTDLNDCAVEQQVQQNPLTRQQPQLYCCDYVYGQKWCAMTSGPFGVGLPCVCAGVAGSGFQCY